jgi:2-polyprenyl-3-methyl-5-hydroxy-6-metoxy-1,4-benzoquinol methylase
MACSQCLGIERQFDDPTARRELRRYNRRGPPKSTRLLLDALRAEGVTGRSFLDIGGGIGAIQHELMAAGAAGGTHADASPAYLEASRDEAERRGHGDRINYLEGDFVEVREDAPPADIVTLDRVLCCYPEMPALVDASAARARRLYAIVFPRERTMIRLGIALINLVQRIRRHPFRVFLHATEAVEARVRTHGLSKSFHATTFLWQVTVFSRPEECPATGD